MDIHAARQRLADLRVEADGINATLASEGRVATAAEDSRLQEILDEAPGLRALESSLDAGRQLERAFREVPADDVRITGGDLAAARDMAHGFKHSGEFVMAVKAASAGGGAAVVDERLLIGAAPTSYGSEGVGADGGYLVPPEFSSRIYSHSLEGQATIELTDNYNVMVNSMRFPADETTPWGSSGVIAYWEAEAAQATQTKPSLKGKDLRLSKLFALVPMTEELIADASAGGAYVERKTGESIRWKTNDALINGTGAGQPMGILNAGSLVTQAKVTSQSADTINATNITSMFARNTNPGRAQWHVNPDAWHQLPLMTIGDQPIFTAPTGTLIGSPAGFLLGRPVVMDDSCQTLGDLGDIFFADWSGYVSITKAGGVQTATSIYLWFDYDVQAFRATFRVDGQPWAGAAVTPPNSAITRSSFVTLAARA